MGFWALLEKASGAVQKQNIRDFFNQGIFVSACVLISIFIDRYLLEAIVNYLGSEWFSLNFARIVLLPFVLLMAAKITGGSKDIMITKAPTPTQRQYNKK